MHLESNLYGAKPPTENKVLSGNHFEGDILGVSLYSLRGTEDAAGVSMDLRNAVTNAWEKWPGGSIPYVVSGYFGRQERGIIYRAMREFGELSCVSWRPRQPGEKDYVHIVKGEGCHSRVGKTGGAQSLSLGNETISNGIDHILTLSIFFEFAYFYLRPRVRVSRHCHPRVTPRGRVLA